MDTYCWEDKWLGDRPLLLLVPCLYPLSSLRNHSVVSILGQSDLSSSPSLCARCSLTNKEASDFSTLLSCFSSFRFKPGVEILAF